MATDDPSEFSAMEASSILEDSMLDGNGSRSLRPSRRRVQKGSAVVLNADRLRRMVDNQSDHSTTPLQPTASSRPTSASPSMEYHVSSAMASSRSSPEHQLLEALKAKPKVLRSPTEKQKPRGDNGDIMSFDSPSTTEMKTTGSPRRHIKKWSPESAKLVQTLHKDMTATEAAKIICQWYKHKLTNRIDRFTQHGKWPMATAEKVHALVLGHRVRSFFKRHPDIKRLVASQRDVQRVLHELVHQHQHQRKQEDQRFDLQEIIQQTRTQLHGADQQLALSLIKELLGDREKLNHCLFQQRVFVPFPKPGYWSLHVPAQQPHHSHHPHHHQHSAVTGTPPSATRRGGHPSSSNRSHQTTPHRPQSQSQSQSQSQLQASTTHRPIAVAETPPHMKRAMAQHHPSQPHSGGGAHGSSSSSSSSAAAVPEATVGTVKVPVKLYVGHQHRSLIDDSWQHAQGMQAYLTPTTAPTATDADQDASENNKHKPQSLHELLESVSDLPTAASTATTSRYLDDDRPIRGAAVPMHTILERLNEEDVDAVVSSSSSSAVETATHPTATAKRKSLRTSRAAAAPTAVAAAPTSSSAHHSQGQGQDQDQGHERKRHHEGCYVQLEVLSGDKLIPARKGAVTKDSVPDRKPSLKVTLFLPTLTTTATATASAAEASGPSTGGAAPFPSSSSSSLKRVAHVVRDYEELTYHPVWNASFPLALPLPRALLRQLFDLVVVDDDSGGATTHAATASMPASLLTVAAEVWHDWKAQQPPPPQRPGGGGDPVGIVQLTETQYEQLTRYLLQHWAAGQILIEVVDGERFNEDIFMGQCLLLLTSFLPSIRKLHDLHLRGTYTLEKQKPTNRVSGTITVQAQWHVPERAYLEEQLTPLLQELWRRELQQHQQRHHHHHYQHQQLPVGGVKLSARTSQKMRQHQSQHASSQAASSNANAATAATAAATAAAAVHASPSSPDSSYPDDLDNTFDDNGYGDGYDNEEDDANAHGADDEAALDRRVHQLHEVMRFFDSKPTAVSPPTATAAAGSMLPASVVRSIVQPPPQPPHPSHPSPEGHAAHEASSGVFQSKFMQSLVASLDDHHHHHHHPPPSSSSSSVLRTPTTTVASPAVPGSHSSSIVVNAAPAPRVRPTVAVSTPPTAASVSAVKRPPLTHPTLEESDNIWLPHWSTPDATAATAAPPNGSHHARPRPRSTPSPATATATATGSSASASASASSQHRRSLLAHMSKQLDVLHAVQHSAEEAVDSYGKRLQAHIHATAHSKSPAPVPAPAPSQSAVLLTPVRVPRPTATATTPASLPPPSPPPSLPPSLPASATRNGVVAFPSFPASPPRPLTVPSHHLAAYPYPTELRSPDEDDADADADAAAVVVGLPRHRSAPHSRPSPAAAVVLRSGGSGGGGGGGRHGSDSSGLLMLSSPSAQRWEAQDVPVYTDLYDWEADGFAAAAAGDETLFDEDVPIDHRQSRHSPPSRFYDDDEDDCVSVPSTTEEPLAAAAAAADGDRLYDEDEDEDAHYGDDSFVTNGAAAEEAQEQNDDDDGGDEDEEEELHVIPSPQRVEVKEETAAPPSSTTTTTTGDNGRRASLRAVPPPPPPPPPPRVPPPPPPPPPLPSSRPSSTTVVASVAPQTPPRSTSASQQQQQQQQQPPPPSSSASKGFRTTPQRASRLSAVLAQVDAALQEVQALTAAPTGPSTGPSSSGSGGAMMSPSRIPKYTAPNHHQLQHHQSSHP